MLHVCAVCVGCKEVATKWTWCTCTYSREKHRELEFGDYIEWLPELRPLIYPYLMCRLTKAQAGVDLGCFCNQGQSAMIVSMFSATLIVLYFVRGTNASCVGALVDGEVEYPPFGMFWRHISFWFRRRQSMPCACT